MAKLPQGVEAAGEHGGHVAVVSLTLTSTSPGGSVEPYTAKPASTSRTKSMSASVWSALTWKRISSSPLGTTG